MIAQLEQIDSANLWKRSATQILQMNDLDLSETKKFQSIWITRGHRIREQIDDDKLLVLILEKLLPPFIGEAKKLYRGENIDRYRSGRIGFCWTESYETAEMFARGLNAIKSGGILLACIAKTDSVISGVADHSKYLEEFEYTINPFKLYNITEVKEYPASH